MKIVGVSLRVVLDEHNESRDAISHDWIRLLSSYNVQPLLICNTGIDLPELLGEIKVSAFLLSNGNNIGESAERDETERKIIEYAIEHKVPLLGVCRGMQMINVYFGGNVCDLKDNAHVATNHQIEIIEHRIYLGATGASVNSFHKQAVTMSTISPSLKPFALADDEIVEGLYHPSLPIIGIQWHPERDNPSKGIDNILIKSWLNQTELF